MAEFENFPPPLPPPKKGRKDKTAFSIRFLSLGKADSWREETKRVHKRGQTWLEFRALINSSRIFEIYLSNPSGFFTYHQV